MMKMFMINCKDATFLISKREEGKIALYERFHLFLHLLMCKFCKLFLKQTEYLSKQFHNYSSSSILSSEDKEQLKKSLFQE